jgi:hypothetical protein
MSELVQVEVEFVKDAYKAACPEWKKKIETKFPEIFHPSLSFIRKLQEKLGVELYGGECYLRDHFIHGDYLAVFMPNSNTGWTFQNWEFIKKLCEEYPDCYPIHYPPNKVNENPKYDKGSNYQFVNISYFVKRKFKI